MTDKHINILQVKAKISRGKTQTNSKFNLLKKLGLKSSLLAKRANDLPNALWM